MIERDIPSAATRFERKYRCNGAQYHAVKNALYPYLSRDYYTQKAPKHRYLVRSLYFDTSHYQMFVQKAGGDSDRIKYRIRTYGQSARENPDIRVEMKIREANLIKKFGAYVTVEECQHFLQHRHWENQDDLVLQEFERQAHLLNLLPKTLVEYYREGFQAKDASGTRITFDHRVKSAHSRVLFPENKFWHIHHEQMIVLEVKHTTPIPVWFSQIAKVHGLRLIANSKFSLGIQASQPDLTFPGWSNF
ncbi:MAG: polyphosphate polymerase domain-containing protein [Chloroflexi bacterium]|nr:polyphosphate polymerase domain-containing protein [Chloroflexota bacterium]